MKILNFTAIFRNISEQVYQVSVLIGNRSEKLCLLLNRRTAFGFSRFGLSTRMPVFSLFSQDNKHMELMVLLFFQNPCVIFTHILQHYHDLQSNVTIFQRVFQAYTLPYSFSGKIKLIIWQIRHELSNTIHDISTG